MFGNLFGKNRKVRVNEPNTSSPPGAEPFEVAGFEAADRYSHVLPWLGRGVDPSEYVPRDVANELARQQPGCRLSRIACTGEPEVQTNVLQEPAKSHAEVGSMVVSFPLLVSVTGPDGVAWRLSVTQTYVATGLGKNQSPQLRQDFKVNEATAV